MEKVISQVGVTTVSIHYHILGFAVVCKEKICLLQNFLKEMTYPFSDGLQREKGLLNALMLVYESLTSYCIVIILPAKSII